MAFLTGGGRVRLGDGSGQAVSDVRLYTCMCEVDDVARLTTGFLQPSSLPLSGRSSVCFRGQSCQEKLLSAAPSGPCLVRQDRPCAVSCAGRLE